MRARRHGMPEASEQIERNPDSSSYSPPHQFLPESSTVVRWLLYYFVVAPIVKPIKLFVFKAKWAYRICGYAYPYFKQLLAWLWAKLWAKLTGDRIADANADALYPPKNEQLQGNG